MSVLPGQTIGMLGGGQLGRMALLAGRKMGYRFAVLESKENSPAGQIADHEVVSAYDNEEGLSKLGNLADVATLEFENIPAKAIEFLSQKIPVRPGVEALLVSQNREREKLFLRDNGIPCTPFEVVDSLETFKAAVRKIGYPSVLKTADFGYDGKGQVKLSFDSDLESIWNDFDSPKGVLEKWLHFEGEYSVIIARNPSGENAVYPLVQNVHRNHILHTTLAPISISKKVAAQAEEIARLIVNQFEYVGVLAIEFFLIDGELWVNEMAPRPHNSGHYTFDASVTSQFEQQIRAVCDLPLGSTELLKPVCMLNILGDVWQAGNPSWEKVLSDPWVKLHLYDKGEPRVGRKMGHLNVFADSAEEALAKAIEIDQFLNKTV